LRKEGIIIDTFHDGQRRIVSLTVNKALRSILISKNSNDGQYDTPKNIVRLKSANNEVIKPILTMNDTNDDARTLYHPISTSINSINTSQNTNRESPGLIVRSLVALENEEIPQNSSSNSQYNEIGEKNTGSLATVSTVEDSTPITDRNSYLMYECPWTLKDIIEGIIEIYSIPLTRNQFILALGRNSYITNAGLAYEAAIKEKIIHEQNGRITKSV